MLSFEFFGPHHTLDDDMGKDIQLDCIHVQNRVLIFHLVRRKFDTMLTNFASIVLDDMKLNNNS